MSTTIQIGMSASDVKDALRRRHPAYEPNLAGIGRWVCIEEWKGIDLLALDAWQAAAVVGYEVKISRSDMRTELLHPDKRAQAVSMCTRFYFAVPAGLLTHEEKSFQEPASWTSESFTRGRCPGIPAFGPPHLRRLTSYDLRYGGQCKGTPAKGSSFGRRRVQPYTIEVPVPVVLRSPETPEWAKRSLRAYESWQEELVRRISTRLEDEGTTKIPCPTCGGRGYTSKSAVELEAPMLWVPNDVGLIEVDGRGCRVVREAPGTSVPQPIASYSSEPSDANPTAARYRRQGLAQLVRWVSARPDPRHRASYSDRMNP